MKFLIITEIPPRQTILGVTPMHYKVDYGEAESAEDAKEGLHVPLGGKVLLVPNEHVITMRSKIVTEEVT